ncbi:MAG TPA: primosomal protein N' [Pseudonocardiaceae bacterium]|jgi:primosomal protein N' (replication factor Y)|nr:primosomal protein N' [Pseudonocardiaceae bacterium]
MTSRNAPRRGERQPAAHLSVARVCVDVPLAHLDRPFDYRVPSDLDADVVPGCRVRVRFAGQLVDGFVLARVEESGHQGKLAFLERVTSPEPVLSPQLAELARVVADRYAGMLIDVLRLAIPPRHAKTEREPAVEPAPPPAAPDVSGWQRYPRGPGFLDAVRDAKPRARAVWQALPMEDWPARLAEAAAVVAATGRGAVLVVPDYRDVARLHAACVALLGEDGVVALSADVGPAERYRRWLKVHRGSVRVVIGTRAAMFAPVADPGLFVVWDDGDDLHAEQRAPYPHVRDVLVQRAHLTGAALLVGGFARTAEAQLLVASGWAQEIIADRATLRSVAPRVTAIGESDEQLAKDAAARAARLPSVAFDAARAALAAGAPVLIQVPRRGYVPALACAQCRAPARCRHCAGPLALPGNQGRDEARPAACRWCGATEAAFRCPACASRRLRAVVVGSKRTAEELGRAFPGVAVRTSGGGKPSAGDDANKAKTGVLASIPAGPALVVATPGAEPLAEGGYGAALLLDGWALLSRAELRSAEETLRRWMTAAALVRPSVDGGRVIVIADSTLVPVQALIRWDPVWYAAGELASRAELGFPPAMRMAAVDADPKALGDLLDSLRLPDAAEILGPVPIETPQHGPQGAQPQERERALIRAPREQGGALAAALFAAIAVRTARKEADPVRVQLDPLELV